MTLQRLSIALRPRDRVCSQRRRATFRQQTSPVDVSRLALNEFVQEMGPNHGSFATCGLFSAFAWQDPEPPKEPKRENPSACWGSRNGARGTRTPDLLGAIQAPVSPECAGLQGLLGGFVSLAADQNSLSLRPFGS